MPTDRSAAVLRWLGLALFAGTGFFYAASGLVAPLWGVAVLWVIWIGLAILVIRWWRRNAWVVFLIPFAAAALWGVVLFLGQTLFDWTA